VHYLYFYAIDLIISNCNADAPLAIVVSSTEMQSGCEGQDRDDMRAMVMTVVMTVTMAVQTNMYIPEIILSLLCFACQKRPIDRMDGVGLLATATRILSSAPVTLGPSSSSSSASSLSTAAKGPSGGASGGEYRERATAAAHNLVRKRKVEEAELTDLRGPGQSLDGAEVARKGVAGSGDALPRERENSSSPQQAIRTLLSMSGADPLPVEGGGPLLLSRLGTCASGSSTDSGNSAGENVADVLSRNAMKRIFPQS
jgi:hypothetical protein